MIFRIGQRVIVWRNGLCLPATVRLSVPPLAPYLPCHLWLIVDGDDDTISTNPSDVTLTADLGKVDWKNLNKTRGKCRVCGCWIAVVHCNKCLGVRSHRHRGRADASWCAGSGQRPIRLQQESEHW
jgi:hypothetical protein